MALLTKDDLRQMLTSGVLELLVDTNAFFKGGHGKLMSAVEKHNNSEGKGSSLKVLFPALCHGELSFQNRRRHGENYDEQAVQEALEVFANRGGAILSFDAEAGAHYAEKMGANYPSDTAWKQVRKGQPVHGRTAATSVDWFIASQAHHPDRILVSDDDGVEMENVQRVPLKTVLCVLEELVGEPCSPYSSATAAENSSRLTP